MEQICHRRVQTSEHMLRITLFLLVATCTMPPDIAAVQSGSRDAGTATVVGTVVTSRGEPAARATVQIFEQRVIAEHAFRHHEEPLVARAMRASTTDDSG